MGLGAELWLWVQASLPAVWRGRAGSGALRSEGRPRGTVAAARGGRGTPARRTGLLAELAELAELGLLAEPRRPRAARAPTLGSRLGLPRAEGPEQPRSRYLDERLHLQVEPDDLLVADADVDVQRGRHVGRRLRGPAGAKAGRVSERRLPKRRPLEAGGGGEPASRPAVKADGARKTRGSGVPSRSAGKDDPSRVPAGNRTDRFSGAFASFPTGLHLEEERHTVQVIDNGFSFDDDFS